MKGKMNRHYKEASVNCIVILTVIVNDSFSERRKVYYTLIISVLM